jgi:hypothetical protein
VSCGLTGSGQNVGLVLSSSSFLEHEAIKGQLGGFGKVAVEVGCQLQVGEVARTE